MLDGVNLGLDAHHLQRGLHRQDSRPNRHHIEHRGQDDDVPSPVANTMSVKKLQRQIERSSDECEPPKMIG